MTQTLPWQWYSDPDVLAREQALLFSSSWHYVGHRGDLPGGGGYFPTRVAAVPIVVTKRPSGELAALVNVCRHRGAVVCTAAGSRDGLVCPYHAWRYDLDGRLLSAPRSDRETGFDPADHALERVSIASWGPFLFVNLDPGAPAFEEVLADLPDRIADVGVVVDDLVFHSRSTSEPRANWKVIIENFLECYHCRVAHPDFARTIATDPDDFGLVTAPTYSSQYGPVRAEAPVAGFDPHGPIGRSQFHVLYPNTVFNIMPGRPNLSLGPVVPTGPTTTHRTLDYFVGPDVDPEWVDAMIAFDSTVGAEDLVLVESVQQGLNARPGERGMLFVDSELLIAHFNDYVRKRLGE